jgi:hypothetical protein
MGLTRTKPGSVGTLLSTSPARTVTRMSSSCCCGRGLTRTGLGKLGILPSTLPARTVVRTSSIFSYLDPPVPSMRPRFALVIGNNYVGEVGRTLPSCFLDADRMTERLTELHFTVTKLKDVANLGGAVKTFAASLTENCMAFVYFSGHGIADNRESRLLPAKLNADLQLVDLYSLFDLVQDLGRKSALTIGVFDMCREDPDNNAFKGISVARDGGLTKAPSTRAQETPVAANLGHPNNPKNLDQQFAFIFPCDPGCVAHSGSNVKCSPFTECLLEILHHGVSLSNVSTYLSNEVPKKAEQRVWCELGGLKEEVFF